MDTPTDPISRDTISRRTLIGAAAGSLMTASSYARIIGANDRIQIGMLGCGHRSSGHRKMLKLFVPDRFEFRGPQRMRPVVRQSGKGRRRPQRSVREPAEDVPVFRGNAGGQGPGCGHDRAPAITSMPGFWPKWYAPARIATARSRWRIRLEDAKLARTRCRRASRSCRWARNG